MDSKPLQRGDIICLTRDEFTTMFVTYRSNDTTYTDIDRILKTKQQVLYAWGLREDVTAKPCCYITCAVIYPKRYMMMKLRHGI